jgi:hypothetical protein
MPQRIWDVVEGLAGIWIHGDGIHGLRPPEIRGTVGLRCVVIGEKRARRISLFHRPELRKTMAHLAAERTQD